MSSNCLVTKLKATVDNADLKFFDAIELRTSTTVSYGTLVSLGKVLTGGVGVIVKILSENGTITRNGENVGREYQMTGTESLLRFTRTMEDGKPIRILLKGIKYITNFAPDTASVFTVYFDELNYVAPNLKPYNGGVSMIKPPIDSGVVGNGNWIKYISDKDSVTSFSSSSAAEGGTVDVDLASFSDFINLTALPVSKVDYIGNVSSIRGLTKLTKLQFGNESRIFGDVSSIKDLVLVKTVEFNGCPNIGGDIASFSRMTDLSTLRISSTQINGSIENLVSGLIASRTSAGLTKAGAFELYINGIVTFEGKTFTNGTHITVSWDDYGTITLS